MKRLLLVLALLLGFAHDAGAVSYPDGSFEIYDGADLTKRIGFEVALLTTGTKRIFSWPDASTTVAGLSVAQTFTAQQNIRAATAVPSLIVTRNAGATEIMQVFDGAGTPVKRFAFHTAGRAMFNTTSATGWVNAAPDNMTQAALSTTFTQTGIAGSANTNGVWRLGGSITGDGVDEIGATAWLRVAPTVTGFSATQYPIEVAGTYTDGAAGSGTFAGIQVAPSVTLSGGGSQYGIRATPTFTINGSTVSALALNFQVNSAGSGNNRSIGGASGTVLHTGSGTAASAVGLGSAMIFGAGSGAVTTVNMVQAGTLTTQTAVTDFYAFRAGGASTQGAGSITNGYAFKADSNWSLGPANDWFLYNPDNSPSYTRGKLGVGAAGMTPVNDVDVKGTISSSALTAGRVTFAGTGGLLTDDADAAFAGDVLTATKVTVPTQANFGSTAGSSYWKIVSGDDMVCRDDNDWNYLKIRNTTPAGGGLTWADAESTYQVQLGDVVETDPGPGVRNLMITGSGNTGSVFDRLGIASLGTVLKNGLWTAFAAPTSLLDIVNSANSARPLQRWVPHGSQSTDIVQTRNAANDSTRFAVGNAGRVTTYGNIPTAANGLPSAIAQVDLTAQGAAIAATTAYAVPAGGQGMYSVAWVATVTRAATTSSVLGGTNAFQCIFTDPDDSVVKTSSPTTTTAHTTAGNTTGDTVSGVIVVRCKASTNLQYAFDYTSVGATTMQYNLHIVVTRL